MKTYNKEVVETAKRLSQLSKNKLFQYSRYVAKLSTFLIFVGVVFLLFNKEILGEVVVILGIISLLTSEFNIFRSKDS